MDHVITIEGEVITPGTVTYTPVTTTSTTSQITMTTTTTSWHTTTIDGEAIPFYYISPPTPDVTPHTTLTATTTTTTAYGLTTMDGEVWEIENLETITFDDEVGTLRQLHHVTPSTTPEVPITVQTLVGGQVVTLPLLGESWKSTSPTTSPELPTTTATLLMIVEGINTRLELPPFTGTTTPAPVTITNGEDTVILTASHIPSEPTPAASYGILLAVGLGLLICMVALPALWYMRLKHKLAKKDVSTGVKGRAVFEEYTIDEDPDLIELHELLKHDEVSKQSASKV